jgi:hypothetical protein
MLGGSFLLPGWRPGSAAGSFRAIGAADGYLQDLDFDLIRFSQPGLRSSDRMERHLPRIDGKRFHK